MSAALGIAPADEDELLAVEAFRLQPSAPIGLIPAINALRDNAFEAALAGQAMEGRALADLMIVVSERLRRTGQERLQAGLSLDQRQHAGVFAIQEQQVEQEEDQRSLARIGRVLNQVERRPAIGQHPTEFTIKVG